MRRLIVFIGKGGSGKTTLITQLSKRYPDIFKRVITYTSRARREGEIDGIDYYFRPVSFFDHNPELVLTNSAQRTIRYGTAKKDLVSDTHHLLLSSKPTGIQKLAAMGFNNVLIIHISIDECIRVARMKQRGDTEDTIRNRQEIDASETLTCTMGFPVIEFGSDATIDEMINTLIGCVNW